MMRSVYTSSLRFIALTVLLLLAGGVLFFAALSLRQDLLTLGREASFFSNLGFFILINGNLIVVLVLVFLVVKNVGKLLLDRKRNILGSRLRTRLVTAFVSLSLIPTVLLFLVARGIIETVLQGWFSPQITAVVDGALDIANFHYRDADNRITNQLENISEELSYASPLLSQETNLADNNTLKRILESYFNRKRDEYGLFEIAIVDAGGRQVVHSTQVSQVAAPLPSLAAIRAVFSGKPLVRAEQSLDGEFIRGYGSLGIPSKVQSLLVSEFIVPKDSSEGSKEAPSFQIDQQYILVATEFVSPELSSLLVSVLDAHDDYKELRMFRQPIVSSYILTLVIVMLLIIFGAIWVGLYLAKSWSVPITQVAAGTEAVALGNLSYRIPEVGDDELGVLVRSFNKMTEDLEQTTDELVRRRQYMETVLANVGVGVISLDHLDQITTFNQAARDILGIDASKILQGKVLREVVPVSLASHVKELVTSIREENERVTLDTFSTSIDGEPKHLQLTLTLLEDSEHGNLGAVLLLDDLTELVSAQRMAAWREVARRIAHEIKNPLTPIQLCAQRLQRRFSIADNASNIGSENAQIIEESTMLIVKQVENLRTLVNEFSRFARMPKSQLHPADINALIEETVAMYRKAHCDIQFVVDADPTIPPLDLDVEQMSRVLVNLIDNAVASILIAGDADGEIILHTSFDKELEIVQITVADNGVGIAEEDKPRLFEPYFSTKKHGTGLGLAIVSTIIADHQGYIRVRDNSPRGVLFIIELPVSSETSETAEEKLPQTAVKKKIQF